MKIVYPLAEYWSQGDIPHAHIGRCARICYRADKRNDEKLTQSLWKNNHRSMFRHWSRYFVIPILRFSSNEVREYLKNHPFIFYYYTEHDLYISTNEQWIKEHKEFYNLVASYEVTENRIFKLAKENNEIYNIIRYTFRCVTQISTSREFNRVSPNNIAEQSTRYVYDDGTICKPHWITDEEINIWTNDNKRGLYNDKLTFQAYTFLNTCKHIYNNYKKLCNNNLLNLNKQDARGILPLDTATVCAYTYSGFEWKHILDMRLRGTTGAPHPNAAQLAKLISDKLSKITNNIIF